MESQNNYYYYLSVLKVMAMFAVIGIHTFCMPINISPGSFNNVEYFFSFFITNILKLWAVPVFIMVSGALFLDPGKELPIQKLFSKYILRLFLVLLIFGTFYSLLEIIFTNKDFQILYLWEAFLNMLQGKSWDALWYIYMTIGLYLISIPLRCFIKSATDKELIYTLFLLIIFLFVLPTITKATHFSFGVYLPINRYHIVYFLLGYMLNKEIIEIKKIYSSLIMITIFVLIAVFSLLKEFHSLEACSIKYFDIYEITGLLLSVSIFSFIQSICKGKQEKKIVSKFLAPNSLGVYIFHMLFLNFIYKFMKITPDRYPVVFVWITAYCITAFGALLLSYLLRKIPFVRKHIL